MKTNLKIEGIRKGNNGKGLRYLLKCNYCSCYFELCAEKINNKRGHFCNNECTHGYQIGDRAAHWKGGRSIIDGYVRVPNPYKNRERSWISEHRLVIENFLKTRLSEKDIVHHINGIRHDNRLENLILFPSQKEHNYYHKKQRKNFGEGFKEG